MTKAAERTCLLVLGMHRSGTSALTRVLNLMGAALPKTLMAPNDANPAGYWEPNRLVALNDQMLEEAGSRWDDWRPFDPQCLGPERLAYYRDAIRETIADEYGDAPLFVLKDPRICRFVPLYESILADMGISTQFVLIHRHPDAVVASLAARDGITSDYAGLMWLRHVLEAEAATRRKPRAVVAYEYLLDDPHAAVRDLAARLSVRWPMSLEVAAPAIVETLRRELQHHRSGNENEPAGSQPEDLVQRAYDAFCLRSHDSDDVAGAGTLAQFRKELDDGIGLADALSIELFARERRAVRDRNRLEAERRSAHSALDAAATKNEQIAEALITAEARYRQETGSLQERLTVSEKHASDLARSLDDAQKRIAESESAAAAARKELVELTAALAQRESAAAAASKELAELTAVLAQREVAAKASEQQLAETRAQLKEQTEQRNSEISHRTELEGHLAEAMFREEALVRSRSWRLTKPIRFASRLARGQFKEAFSTTSPRLVGAARALYRLTPLPRSTKEQRLLPFIFARSGTLFAGAPAYEAWRMRSQPVADTLSPATAETKEDNTELVLETSNDPKLSIIIPCYGRLDHTLACLKSIARHPPKSPIEIVVVDDASGDPQMDRLHQVEGIRYSVNRSNLGFLRTCNHAAEQARGQYLHFLNNDTEVTAGWLDELLEVFENNDKCGAVGSKLIYPDGRMQEAGGMVWRDASAWNFGRFSRADDPSCNYVKEVDYASAASLLIRTSLFAELGGFDEAFVPAYYEDTDLAFRVRRHGYKVFYQPRSVVVHHEGVSHGVDETSGGKRHQAANAKVFRQRWEQELSRAHFSNGEAVFLAKDRSTLKKTVLVIDHYVPRPDKDAGSRSMLHFLLTFVDHGLSVKFWPDNLWYDPVYTPPLQQAGIEVYYGSEYVSRLKRWLATNGAHLDYVLLSRPHISHPLIDMIRQLTNAKILYYGHDVHHLRLQRQLEAEPGSVTQGEIRQAERWELDLWKKADAVYYPAKGETEYVKRRVPKACARTVPVYAYADFAHAPEANIDQRDGILFVGGFGHRPNVQAAVWLVHEVLPLLLRQHPDAHLWIVGASPPQEVLQLQGSNVTVTGHVTDAALRKHYERRRIAVAPLKYGGGMKGKVVEAMRFGLPCVTTPTGAQGLDDIEGILHVAETAEAFASGMSTLLSDNSRWMEQSSRATSYARKHFSATALWDTLSKDVDPAPYSSVAKRTLKK